MIIFKGQVPHTTHSYTKHSPKKKKLVEKERQQKKAKKTTESTKLIKDFETRNTVKYSCYKDYKASKGFGGTGE